MDSMRIEAIFLSFLFAILSNYDTLIHMIKCKEVTNLFEALTLLLKSAFCFTASYSNNVFPEPLEKEEEEKAIELSLKGDSVARNLLIEHNLRLVAHIVKKFEQKNISQDDLISIGTIGLIKGVDSFSNKHGTKLTTYCARCIENVTLTSRNSYRPLNISLILC